MKVYVCVCEVIGEGYMKPDRIFGNKKDAVLWKEAHKNYSIYEFSIEEYEVE